VWESGGTRARTTRVASAGGEIFAIARIWKSPALGISATHGRSRGGARSDTGQSKRRRSSTVALRRNYDLQRSAAPRCDSRRPCCRAKHRRLGAPSAFNGRTSLITRWWPSRGSENASLAKKFGASVYSDSKTKNAAEELQSQGGARVILATAPSSKAMSELIDGPGRTAGSW
jgi:hypothetical protein